MLGLKVSGVGPVSLHKQIKFGKSDALVITGNLLCLSSVVYNDISMCSRALEPSSEGDTWRYSQ